MIRSLKLLALLLLALAAASCAEVYHRPPSTASLEERAQVYTAHYATYDWFHGLRVGGHKIEALRFGGTYAASVAGYFDASGDTVSAGLARKAVPYYYSALGIGLAGLVTGLAGLEHWDNSTWFWMGAGLGLGGEILTIKFGTARYFPQAAQAYNEYLRHDLDLDQEPVKPLEPVIGTGH